MRGVQDNGAGYSEEIRGTSKEQRGELDSAAAIFGSIRLTPCGFSRGENQYVSFGYIGIDTDTKTMNDM